MGDIPNLPDTAKPILVHVTSTCCIIIADSNKTAAGCDVCTLGETAKNAARGMSTGTGPDAANTGPVLMLIIEAVAMTEGVRGGTTTMVLYNLWTRNVPKSPNEKGEPSNVEEGNEASCPVEEEVPEHVDADYSGSHCEDDIHD